MRNTLQILATTSLFQGLPPDQLDALCAIGVEKKYKIGEMIFSEGEEGDGFYIVLEGQVKIFKVSSDGKEQILHIFGAGEPIGEAPVFSGERFPASALALKKSALLFFPRRSFVGLLEHNTSLTLNMLAVLSRRLRQFTVQIENLSLKEVPGRLAAYLLYLAKEKGNAQTVTLGISKGQLASLLGTIPETLSRILAKMSQQELVSVKGREIELLDVEGLVALAEHGKLDKSP